MNSPGSQSNSHELKIFYGYGVTGSFIIKSLSHLDVFAVLVTGLVTAVDDGSVKERSTLWNE